MSSIVRMPSGRILRLPNGSIARGLDCCCNPDICCDRLTPFGPTPEYLPPFLTAVFASDDCPCIDGVAVQLDWDPIRAIYRGQGPGGVACALLQEYFNVSCGSNPDATEDCENWQFSVEEVTVCVMVPQPAYAEPGCTCDPIHLEFTFTVQGIGCCDGSMSGPSPVIHVTVDE